MENTTLIMDIGLAVLSIASGMLGLGVVFKLEYARDAFVRYALEGATVISF